MQITECLVWIIHLLQIVWRRLKLLLQTLDYWHLFLDIIVMVKQSLQILGRTEQDFEILYSCQFWSNTCNDIS